jgi:integrase
LKNKHPKLQKHKATGQAFVDLNGASHYLGKHGTEAAQAAYDRLISEWLANGRCSPAAGADRGPYAVDDLLLAYLTWAQDYYRRSPKELENIRLSVRPLSTLYGDTAAADFGPMALKAVRQTMVNGTHLFASGENSSAPPRATGDPASKPKPFPLARKNINQRVNRIKAVFRWGVEEERIPPSVFHGLQAVRGLPKGRSAARETADVKPVPEAFVDAIELHVAPQVWAMVQLHRFTGMRPGEVIIMRSCDLDTSGRVWIYTPAAHKTEHHGHRRQIYIGPRAQKVLRPWLRVELGAFLFQPKEAIDWHWQKLHGKRRGARQTQPRKLPGEVYSVASYRRAIKYACLKTETPDWHPHQLRHNAATWLRKEFGLDVARCVLGHRSAAVTEIYAEVDFEKARQAMETVG